MENKDSVKKEICFVIMPFGGKFVHIGKRFTNPSLTTSVLKHEELMIYTSPMT